ncbi:type II toxin-antitoxin system Phd/YefM family antitoxin [Dehalococcoidia bacterium]|nr:type II toxin-antitoxin system Phd/YefM family antitoxin [Dehalococcoidia bacterium]MCL0079215.1 type II toxin-antitoxin system Phd/YefM family antitoxin [Dehalococcoidia bacterium]MCL0098181.1 type II toxin-antitoxin system Phd/YefM family antitoxin [Dehalococcoidia bacterium]
MHEVRLKEAKVRLAELIDEAAYGEEVVITKSDGTAYKIVPIKQSRPYPKFGSAKGLIEISDDFDEPLEDFKDYMP